MSAENFELEPSDNLPFISFEVNGEIYESTRNNTRCYTHRNPDHRQYDHIFIYNLDEEDPTMGIPLFRDLIENFDETLETMRTNNYTFVIAQNAANEDVAVFDLIHTPDDDGEAEPVPVEVVYQDLTPRQENFVNYFRYLVDNEHFTITDFTAGEGELMI